MLVEQAIYTSAETDRGRGYHLVSKSEGISPAIASQLIPWCPSHDSLTHSDPDFSSLNFHSLNAHYCALSRTVYGDIEYSNRGGRQVVTYILVINYADLEKFNGNPIAVARLTRSLGHMRFTNQSFQKSIPTLTIPSECPSECIARRPNLPASLEQVAIHIRRSEGVAVLAGSNEVSIIESVVLSLRPDLRSQVSFTSGLRPSGQRPFQLHILPEAGITTKRKLDALGIQCVRVD